jgi:hypothetical protein
MVLYHFTSARHLRSIAKYGLTVGDVPINLRRGLGRIGVWLTTSNTADGHGLDGSAVDKKAYRLKVSVPDHARVLKKWLDWASRHVAPDTMQILHRAAEKAGGTSDDPETWFVYFGVLPPETIIECVNVRSQEVVTDWANVSPPELDVKPVPPWRRVAWQKRMLKDVRRASSKRQ